MRPGSCACVEWACTMSTRRDLGVPYLSLVCPSTRLDRKPESNSSYKGTATVMTPSMPSNGARTCTPSQGSNEQLSLDQGCTNAMPCRCLCICILRHRA